METVESFFLLSVGGPCLTAVEEGTENASLAKLYIYLGFSVSFLLFQTLLFSFNGHVPTALPIVLFSLESRFTDRTGNRRSKIGVKASTTSSNPPGVAHR